MLRVAYVLLRHHPSSILSTSKVRMVLLSAIYLLGSLSILADAAKTNYPDQGPRDTSMVNGEEVWQLGGTTYKGNVMCLHYLEVRRR
jgi:hypothetical protein